MRRILVVVTSLFEMRELAAQLAAPSRSHQTLLSSLKRLRNLPAMLGSDENCIWDRSLPFSFRRIALKHYVIQRSRVSGNGARNGAARTRPFGYQG